MTACGAAGCTANAAGLLTAAAAAPLWATESGAAVATIRVMLTRLGAALARTAMREGGQAGKACEIMLPAMVSPQLGDAAAGSVCSVQHGHCQSIDGLHQPHLGLSLSL